MNEVKKKITHLLMLSFFILILFVICKLHTNFSLNDNNVLHAQIEQDSTIEDIQNSDSDSVDKIKTNQFVITLNSGDTLISVLRDLNIRHDDIVSVMKLSKKNDLHKKIKAQNDIIIEVELPEVAEDNIAGRQLILSKILMPFNKKSKGIISRNITGLHYSLDNAKLEKKLVRHEINIVKNIAYSIDKLGLKFNNLNQLLKSYSGEINFKKNIKNGDKLILVVEKFYDEKKKFIFNGDIVYASIFTGGKKRDLYYYSHNNQARSFFREDGRKVYNNKTKSLAMPLKNIKVNSRYGMRMHPVLKVKKMHKGVDLKGVTGTPIYSAENGNVSFIGRKGGYGNVIEINHHNGLSTLYAHISKFSSDLKRGSHVKRGQLIAYVGKTGRATAPHLHYEVRVNNKPVDPMRFVKKDVVTALKNAELRKFQQFKSQINKIDGDKI